jgi:hypothetical protein
MNRRPSLRVPTSLSMAPAAAALCFVCAVASAVPARAAGSRTLSEGAPEFLQGELRGVALDSSGQLVSAPRVTRTWHTDALHVWSLARDRKGRLLVGTGDSGAIFRQQGDTLLPWVHTLAFEILCLMPQGDELLAGSSPDGVVYRVTPDGTASVALDVPQQSVWDLAEGSERGSWLAATGPGARVVRVSTKAPSGEVLLELPAANATTLLRDAAGLWIGTSTPALVARVEGSDGPTCRIAYEAKEEEIRRIVGDGEQGVYVLTVGGSSPAAGPPPATPAPSPGAASGPHGGGEPGGSGPGGSGVPISSGGPTASRIVWIPRSGGFEEIYASAQRLLSLARLSDGTLLAGEAESGRLLHIDRRGRREIWTDLDGGDALALQVDGDGAITVGTGNQGKVVQLAPERRAKGQITSRVVEARQLEQWGRLTLEGETEGVTVRTRSGFRNAPDTTWSPWSDPQPSGEPIRSPVGPYLQYRLELGSPASQPRVAAVRIAYRERNLPPRIHALRVEPAGGELQSGGVNSSPPQVSQRFDDGLAVEYQVYTRRAGAPAELTAWARGLRTVRWEADDPNDDDVRYAVDVRREPDGAWQQLATELRDPLYAWDTRAFEDGIYRVRVRANDGQDNPALTRRESEEVTGTLHVDNTPPVVLELRFEDDARTQVTARVRDASSPIADVAVRTQQGEWEALSPVDGVLDSSEEQVHGPRPQARSAADSDWIWLRAVDAAGNVVLRELRDARPAKQ